MKNILFSLFAVFLSLQVTAQDANVEANTAKKVPAVKLVDMKGKAVNTAELTANGPVIISFWATWCAPCKKELNTVHELYADWVEETGVTLVAVAIDDEKTKSQVSVYVNGKAWDYVVLMDPNWEIPFDYSEFSKICSGEKEVVGYIGFYCGDEEVHCGWQSWVAPAQPRRLTSTARDIGGQSQAATTQPKGLAKAYLAALS